MKNRLESPFSQVWKFIRWFANALSLLNKVHVKQQKSFLLHVLLVELFQNLNQTAFVALNIENCIKWNTNLQGDGATTTIQCYECQKNYATL